jgi:DNA-binding transcriptional MerR regulator
MTKSEKIAAIEHIIDRDKLAVRCREQPLVYRRAYLMTQLRELGMPFKEIGRMLKRDHATAMYAIRMHDFMVSVRDKIYLSAIDEYVKELNGEIVQVQRQRDLQKDIMKVKTYSQVKTIQMRIKRGEYGNNVTI